MKIHHKENYKTARRKEYPPVEEQLDAFWKGGAEEVEMRKKIKQVKEKYPKQQVKKQA